MNIFSEEPFLSPDYLYGQYPPSRKYVWGIISPPRPSLERPNLKKLTSPPKRRKELFLPPLFYTAQALRSRGGVTENVPTLFLPFLHENGMRAMHLYEDTSPPYPEVFRTSLRE